MPDTRTLALSFEVTGLPPAQSAALSIFAAGHCQAARVRALLHAARVRAMLHAAYTAAQQSGRKGENNVGATRLAGNGQGQPRAADRSSH